MMPLSITGITEIVPLNLRGKLILLVSSFTTLGKLFSIFLCYLCSDSTMHANWRLLMLLNGLTAIIAPILCYKYLLESARFYIANKQF